MTTSNYSDGIAFVRGQYVPIAEASISMNDWGFLRSDATYDVVTVWDGAFFRLDAHLERFLQSCTRCRIDPGCTPEQITGVFTQCVRLSGLRASYVEMICMRSKPQWGSRDPRLAINQFYAFAVPYVWPANALRREKGLHRKRAANPS
jgi:branched-chain amino acid aminotransferase